MCLCQNNTVVIRYINLSDVYNSFEMKKELEKKITKIQDTRQAIIDSLKMDLLSLSRAVENNHSKSKELTNSLQYKQKEFLSKQREFEETNETMINEYNNQIWKQINEYVNTYRKENKIDFIYGADGSGVLMAAEEKWNISKDVSDYINKKYQGN